MKTFPHRLSVVFLAVLFASRAWAADLPPSLKALEKKGARVGAVFMVNGKAVIRHRAAEKFNPASVTKLFTAALALDVLGGDRTLSTRVVASSKGRNPKALTVIGSGDPVLTHGDLADLAACVKKRGVRRVGRLALDLGPFDRHALPPAFGQKSTEAPYRAGIGGFQVDFNRVVIKVSAGRPGKRPRVTVTPKSAYTRVKNKATTSRRKRRRRHGLAVRTAAVKDGRMDVRVTGTARRGRSEVVAKRVFHPARHAGYVFRRALRNTGVKVIKGPVLGKAPKGGRRLCSHTSPTVSSMLRPMLKSSQNQIAESLLRLSGAKGAKGPVGFTEGPRAMKKFLVDRVGLKAESFRFKNGSGLYDANRVTPSAAVRLLSYVLDEAAMAPIIDALPIAGTDGTLRSRLSKTPLAGRVRAKTGTLDEAVSLAGYMELPNGRIVVFAVMVNGRKLNARSVRKATDRALLDVYRKMIR
ncbi:MAG: D-alanyl-D-alanine carboxypeptidase/D-alanyl-D-alanine-endopeptidase [Deltaproteobacteria bacterium]|nr:D-alanyl-D-alanine carboxypeptidase/D-alanyl-D-alanine-endopeptidase [Deltaproteobacteria bacterium]